MEIRIEKDTRYSIVGNAILTNNHTILLVGYTRNELTENYSIIITELTQDLQVLFKKKYSTAYSSIGYTDLVKDASTAIYSGDYLNGNEENIFTYRFDTMGDIVDAGFFNISNKYHFSTAVNPKSKKIVYAVAYSSYMGTRGNMFIADSDFNLLRVDTIPHDMFFYHEIRFKNDSLMYLTGKNLTQGDDNYRILLLDTLNQIRKDVILGSVDTCDYPAIDRNLSFLNSSQIYCGMTKNYDKAPPLTSTFQSYFSIYQLNGDLAINLHKFYGGDAYYILQQIEATTDGGCLLAGRRYDYLTQDMEFDIVIVKMDSTGLITSTGPEPERLSHDAIVYPNPGNNVLHIESGPQISGAMFYLYDLAGKLLDRKQLNSQTETLQTSALPNGVYLWNIVHNNKTIESGKWVKAD
jgi:hypothetical protein